jgi:hypothetical protein
VIDAGCAKGGRCQDRTSLGLAFEDLEEYTGISKDVHRCFFHAFIKFGSTKLFKEYVIAPNDSNQQAAAHQHKYNITVCHGAIGSTDAVHIHV